MSDSPYDRRQAMTRQHGAATLDAVIAVYRCRKCRREVPTPDDRARRSVPYRDVGTLVTHAKDVAKRLTKETPPKCPSCDRPTQLDGVDIHSFHAAADRDLVIRVVPPASILSSWKSSSHWWTLAEGLVDATLDEHDAATFAASVLRRRIEVATNDRTEREQIGRDAVQLAQLLRGEATMLDLLGPLGKIGQAQASLRIATLHAEAVPNDPTAQTWLGRLSLELGNTEEARRHYERASSIDTENVDARLGIGHCLKAEGRTSEAADYFRALASEEPPVIAARYHMALIALEAEDAEGALIQFRLGETTHPKEVEYPTGCARAFLAMDRIDEARAALVRAEAIDSAHPLVVEVREQIASFLRG